jgi:hypothetical protein
MPGSEWTTDDFFIGVACFARPLCPPQSQTSRSARTGRDLPRFVRACGLCAPLQTPSHPIDVPEGFDRLQRNIAHQRDLAHISPIGERFCDERKFAPA